MEQNYLLLIAGSAAILVFQVNRSNKSASLIRRYTSEILGIVDQTHHSADQRKESLKRQIRKFKDRYNLTFGAAILSLLGITALIVPEIIPDLRDFSPNAWALLYGLSLILTIIEYIQGWITLEDEIETITKIVNMRQTEGLFDITSHLSRRLDQLEKSLQRHVPIAGADRDVATHPELNHLEELDYSHKEKSLIPQENHSTSEATEEN